jgi:hypothetical protein
MLAEAGERQKAEDCIFPGWEPFIPLFVHPLKVAIVEALLYIGEPLSAVQFRKVFGSAGSDFCDSNVRYHLNHLAEVGVLEVVPVQYRSGGGQKQKFFYFARSATKPGSDQVRAVGPRGRRGDGRRGR